MMEDKEEIIMLKVIMFIVLGLFSILLIGTHTRINEFESELANYRNIQINVLEGQNEL